MANLNLNRFLEIVKDHKMIVIKDDNTYRHLNFSNPNCSMHWFEIVTFPGHLVITGDNGTLVFKRMHDMFNFFRNEKLKINPDYWAEKIQSTSWNAVKASYEEFDLDYAINSFRKIIDDNFDEYDYPKEVINKVNEAFKYEIERCENEHEFICAINEFYVDDFELYDVWDGLSTTDYTYSYLFICYAIVWGIQQYDLTKNKQDLINT